MSNLPASSSYVQTTGVDDWVTPPWLFWDLNNRYGFDIDGAATEQTAQCPLWLGPGSRISEDALVWRPHVRRCVDPDVGPDGLVVTVPLRLFINPPWGKAAPVFIRWAVEMFRVGLFELVIVVVAPRHGTEWWIEQIVDSPPELTPAVLWEPDTRIQYDRPPSCAEAVASGERDGDGYLACGHKGHDSNTTPTVIIEWNKFGPPNGRTDHRVYRASRAKERYEREQRRLARERREATA